MFDSPRVRSGFLIVPVCLHHRHFMVDPLPAYAWQRWVSAICAQSQSALPAEDYLGWLVFCLPPFTPNVSHTSPCAYAKADRRWCPLFWSRARRCSGRRANSGFRPMMVIGCVTCWFVYLADWSKMAVA